MQILFIARVDGTKKPLLVSKDFVQDTSYTIQETEVEEINGENRAQKHVSELIKTRLDNTVRRFSKSGSKVMLMCAFRNHTCLQYMASSGFFYFILCVV